MNHQRPAPNNVAKPATIATLVNQIGTGGSARLPSSYHPPGHGSGSRNHGVVVAWGFEAGGEVDYGEALLPAAFSGLVELSDINNSRIAVDPPSEYGSFDELTG